LENLGEVNPTALKLNEMKKRYDFIVEQKLTCDARKFVEDDEEVEATANQKF
jgi:hypothetical protein